MPGDLVGGIMGAAGATIGTALNLFGGARAGKERNRVIDEKNRRDESWFNQNHFESPLERASWQASLSGMLEGHNQRMAAARGASAVSGASAGSVLAEKSAANQSMGQTMREAAASDDQYRQNIDAAYRQMQSDNFAAKLGAIDKKQESLQQAATQASKLGAGFSGSTT